MPKIEIEEIDSSQPSTSPSLAHLEQTCQSHMLAITNLIDRTRNLSLPKEMENKARLKRGEQLTRANEIQNMKFVYDGFIDILVTMQSNCNSIDSYSNSNSPLQFLTTTFNSFLNAYAILDSTPLPAPTPFNPDDLSITKLQNAPLPPVGLLSLQNLTDLSCFCEVFTNFCLVPLLPAGIYPRLDPVEIDGDGDGDVENNDLTDMKVTSKSQAVMKRLGVNGARVLSCSLLAPPPPSSSSPSSPSSYGSSSSSSKIEDLKTIVEILKSLLKSERFGALFSSRHSSDLLKAIITLDVYTSPPTSHPTNTIQVKSSHTSHLIFTDRVLQFNVCALALQSLYTKIALSKRKENFMGKMNIKVKSNMTLSPDEPEQIRQVLSFQNFAGCLLSHIAAESLGSVLDVFVISSSSSSSSAAAGRIAKAISVHPKDLTSACDIEGYYRKVCSQIVEFLNTCSDPSAGNNDSGVLTAHATILLLPLDILDKHVYSKVFLTTTKTRQDDDYHHDNDHDDNNSHAIFVNSKALATLLLSGPPPSSFLSTFFTTTNLTALLNGCLFEDTRSSALVKVREDNEDEDEDGWNLVIFAVLLRSITTITTITTSNQHKHQHQLSILTLVRVIGMSDTPEKITKITRVVVDLIEKDNSIDVSYIHFLLLRIYLVSPDSVSMINLKHVDYKGALSFYSELCERVGFERLIDGGELNGSVRVLEVIRVVVYSNCDGDGGVDVVDFDCVDGDGDGSSSSTLAPFSKSQGHDDDDENEDDEEENDQDSLTLQILPLLSSLLELGNTKRSQNEETILRSLALGLTELSSCKSSEVSSIASYCLALIMSRNIVDADDDDDDVVRSRSRSSIKDLISKGEKELNSKDAAMRARGVSFLGRVLGVLGERVQRRQDQDNEYEYGMKKKNDRKIVVLVEDDDEDDHTFDASPSSNIDEDEDEDLDVLLPNLSNLLIRALNDKESYVYLSAISTLSQIPDISPKYGIEMLSHNLAFNTNSEQSLQLPVNVRIKIGEALGFAVRRRCNFRGEVNEGFSLDEDSVRRLVAVLITGVRDNGGSIGGSGGGEDGEISRRTNAYYLSTDNDNDDNQGEEGGGVEDYSDKKLRLKTGGPIYKSEEHLLLRATCLSNLYDILTNITSSMLPRLLYVYVDLVIDLLNLEKCRVSRRNGGLIGCGIYERVKCELEKEGRNDEVLIELMRGTKESRLYDALVRASTGGYGSASTSVTSSGGSNMGRGGECYDEAVRVRCLEGIDIRNELEKNEPKWRLAKIIVDTEESTIGAGGGRRGKNMGGGGAKVKIVEKMFGKGNGKGGEKGVDIGRLDIDEYTLGLKERKI